MTGFFTTALIGLLAMSTAQAAEIALPVEPTYPTHVVSMTGYNAVAEQTDGDPHTTASGAYSNPQIIAARSVDLKEELPYGTVIEVVAKADTSNPNCGIGLVDEYIGLRVVADSMHSRKRNQIDLMFINDKVVRAAGKKVNPAIALGVCKNIEIKVVGKVDIKSLPKTQDSLRTAIGWLPKASAQNLAIKK